MSVMVSQIYRKFCYLFNAKFIQPRETPKVRITGLLWGESVGDFTHRGPEMRGVFPRHDITMQLLDSTRLLSNL